MPAFRARSAGFTLPEILLAATMGALLLIATASSVGLFGKQLTHLKEQADTTLEGALTTVSDDIRYAWWADAPNPRQLTLCDPSGAQTIYAFSSGSLTVTRPDGSSGTVLDDLSSATFSPQTITRYREAAAVNRAGTFWSTTAPAGAVAQALVIGPGDKLALGFTPTSPAPYNGTTPGITDQLTSSTLGTFNVVVGAVGTVAPILGNLTVALYRARAPNSAIPEGSSLGSVSVAAIGLPAAAAYVLNTNNGHSVNIPHSPLWGWWNSNPRYQLVVTPTGTSVPIDLTSLAAQIQPGYSYTLVLGATISGLSVSVYPVASASQSGIALDTGGAGYVRQALAAVRSVGGVMTMTRTTATSVVNRVLMNLTRNDGTQITGSTMVLGQAMADDRWLGVVPGEFGP